MGKTLGGSVNLRVSAVAETLFRTKWCTSFRENALNASYPCSSSLHALRGFVARLQCILLVFVLLAPLYFAQRRTEEKFVRRTHKHTNTQTHETEKHSIAPSMNLPWSVCSLFAQNRKPRLAYVGGVSPGLTYLSCKCMQPGWR